VDRINWKSTAKNKPRPRSARPRQRSGRWWSGNDVPL